MMIAHTYGETITNAAFEFLEIERRVVVVAFPKFVTLSRTYPNMRRKSVMKFPKAARAF